VLFGAGRNADRPRRHTKLNERHSMQNEVHKAIGKVPPEITIEFFR